MTLIGHNGGPPIGDDREAADRLDREVRYCLRMRWYAAWDPAQWRLWNERVELAQTELDRVKSRNASPAKSIPGSSVAD